MSDERRSMILARLGIGPVWKQRSPAVPDRDALLVGQAPQPDRQIDDLSDQPMDPTGDTLTDRLVDTPPIALSAVANSPSAPATNVVQTGLDWPALADAVAACTACGLCKGRKNTVLGTGDRRGRWLFVGEGPGQQEDLQGEPFVGPSGKLLDNMLKALGLARGDNAYIANVVKCRPAGADGRDRPPSASEIAACMPFLQRQVELIQPAVIVALGKVAAISLLGLSDDTPVASLRGKLHRYRGFPVIVTYHPAYLLRKPADKALAWRDLCMARAADAAAA